MNRAALLADLARDEGFRAYLYDDATGKALHKGDVLKGHPTVGHGWCPETSPCPLDLAQYILGYFADQSWSDLIKAAPWIEALPEPCQRALANMGYNLGVTGLLKFNEFLSLMKLGNYEKAAENLETSLWFRQVGSRATRIQELIRQGENNDG